jgi:uncharacterized protein (DUF1015 family)
MPEIKPFRGLRFSPAHLAPEVLAPPFDVIDEPTRQRLLDGSPHNVVRIDKGPQGHDEAWYQEAADTKARWIDTGILAQDETPALYGYRQLLTLDGVEHERTGLIAAVRLQSWGQGIHPHERTRTGDRADRLMHMRAVHANMSPVFGIFRDPEAVIEGLLAPPDELLLDQAKVDSVAQSFWRIDDPAAVALLCCLMSERDIVIADGHHRYETALAYQAERRQAEGDPAGDQPYDYVMMYLTRAEAPGLCILPTHRIIHGDGELDQERLLHSLHAEFDIRPLWNPGNWAQLLSMAAQDTVALGLALRDMGNYVLQLRDPERLRALAPGLPQELARLDVTILENLILGPHLGISAESLAAGERVTYTVDAEVALEAIKSRQAQAAFLLNSTSVDQIWQVATHGMTMPQKSTYFYPKLLTGLVIYPLDPA